MAYTTLDVTREGPVVRCTLNRPDALNSLNPTLVDELRAFIDETAEDQAIRIVVLAGNGRAFCAGLDLKEGTGETDGGVPAGLRLQRRISEIALKMRRSPQVYIACVHGPACGGGFMLALASDIRIAGRSTRMNAAFIKLGLSGCDVGVSYFLTRMLGASMAAELIMTARFIEADRAYQLGLVSQVVEDDQLAAAADALVDELLVTSPLGLRLSKECLSMSVDAPSLDAVIAMEDRNQILTTQSADFREGIKAFLEKRKPEFTDT